MDYENCEKYEKSISRTHGKSDRPSRKMSPMLIKPIKTLLGSNPKDHSPKNCQSQNEADISFGEKSKRLIEKVASKIKPTTNTEQNLPENQNEMSS